QDMPVIDDLARRERGRRQLHAIDRGVEPPLQQLHQILAGIAAPPHRLLIEPTELALADIGIIALELLLGRQLGPVIGRFLAPLPVLARAVFAPVERTFRTAPQIDAETAVDLVLRFLALAHIRRIRFSLLLSQSGPPWRKRRRAGANRPHSWERRCTIFSGSAKSNRRLARAGMFAAGLALAAAASRVAAPRRLMVFLIAGIAIGLALTGYDLVSDGGLSGLVSVRAFRPFRLNQIAIGLAILLLPVTALLVE